MNRTDLRLLAEQRVEDAKVLLDNDRWSAAYYVAGYAVECGLKACILGFVEKNTEVIFKQRRFSEDCWVHDLVKLVAQADLTTELVTTSGANATFAGYWGVVNGWNESSRYEQKTEAESRALYEAITHDPDGVLIWLQHHW